MQAGTIALSMNCGAYMAEIIRAGIESVDKGQMEASRSMWPLLWKEYASGCYSTGDSDNDPFYYQPVHHYIKGYLNPFRYRIPGTDQYGKDDYSGNTFKSLTDMGDRRYYVYGDHYYAQQDRKEDREEDQTWQIRKQWFTLRT